ncbi:hypothetical protein [Lysobacter sp. FW306-1B-D06B]|uniref:hypothetical protein n=1 Tax=Lysobacter sp. FW306-1B-D06B TaxID=3140250 RepID=UPI0031400ECD
MSLTALHPWFGQRCETLLRSRPSLRGGLIWTAAFAGSAGLLMALGASPAGFASGCLRLIATWPFTSAIVIALVIETVASRRLSLLACELRSGWFAALPISSLRVRMTLFVVAIGYGLIGLGAWSAVMVAAWFDASRFVSGSMLPSMTGLTAGIGIGLWRSLRPPATDRTHHAGRREPLFTRAFVTDASLAGVSQWQRRAVVLRWRRGQGGHFWIVGSMFLLLPDRLGLKLATGAVLMVVSWLWASLALRMSLDVAGEARQLLRATPIQAHDGRRAAVGYPLIALACATAIALLGNLVLGFSWMRMVCWLTALALTCLPAAWRLRHASGSAGR